MLVYIRCISTYTVVISIIFCLTGKTFKCTYIIICDDDDIMRVYIITVKKHNIIHCVFADN